MTLPELAALAAEKVPGFKRPVCWCSACTEPADTPGKIRDEYGQWLKCWGCDGSGRVVDDSPAALLMAVAVACRSLKLGVSTVLATTAVSAGASTVTDRTEDQLARAALVALLRAHGVEVGDEH